MLDLFISWSRPLSKEVALLFHELLPALLPGTKPWMSKLDIPKGKGWLKSILSQIGKSPFCIVCISHQNLHSSWIYYEAGGIALAMDDPNICPYLIDVDAAALSETPLGQVQCTVFEKEETWLLVREINRHLENAHDEDVLRGNFDSKWPAFKKKIDRLIAEHAAPEEKQTADTEELSDNAKRLLVEASQDEYGQVMLNANFEGFNLIANGKHVCSTNDAREEAEWKAAVNELAERGFIADQNGKRELFEVVKAGFEMADTLKESIEAQKPLVDVKYSDTDLVNKIHEWFGKQGFKGGTQTITFSDVDAELKIPEGSTKRLLEKAMADYNYFPVPDSIGDHSMRIKYVAPASSAQTISNPGWDNPNNPFRRRSN
jgi:hypothetical protein